MTDREVLALATKALMIFTDNQISKSEAETTITVVLGLLARIEDYQKGILNGTN